MSEDRQTIPAGAVDQGARSAQAEPEEVQSDGDLIEHYKRQLAEMEDRDRKIEEERKADQQAREAAETRARQAESRATAAEGRAQQDTQTATRSADDARLDAVTASLTSHGEKMNTLKGQWAAAGSEGDFVKQADIQAEMALLGGRISQLEAGKQALEARRQTRDAQPQQQPSAEEARENFIRQQPPILQDWLRNHDRYFTDADFRDQVAAAAAHGQKVKGLRFDSQELIDFVETEIGLRQRAEPERQRQQQQNQPSGRDANGRDAEAERVQNRMVAAPAGGSVPNTSRGNDPDQVYLTREEKEQARRDGISEADWARAKRDLMREGMIGPNARSR